MNNETATESFAATAERIAADFVARFESIQMDDSTAETRAQAWDAAFECVLRYACVMGNLRGAASL
jgi:hypothetical protein